MESELGVKPRDTSGEEEREKGAGGEGTAAVEREVWGSKLDIQWKRRRGEGGTGAVERSLPKHERKGGGKRGSQRQREGLGSNPETLAEYGR